MVPELMFYGPHISALGIRVPWGGGAWSRGSQEKTVSVGKRRARSERNQQTLVLQWPGNGREDEDTTVRLV